MPSESRPDRQFTDAFNEANHLWDEDRLEECVTKARELLQDPAIPHFHRMKTLLLLDSTLGDWHEANDCCIDAEALWRIARRWHPEGEDEVVDKNMKEMRDTLDGPYYVLSRLCAT
jgi:hypothetical protein